MEGVNLIPSIGKTIFINDFKKTFNPTIPLLEISFIIRLRIFLVGLFKTMNNLKT